MKNKEMRVNIDISLEEIREFYVENLKLMAKLLEAASNIGDTLEMIAPICRGEEDLEEDSQSSTDIEWISTVFGQKDKADDGESEDPEEEDTEEDNEDEAEAEALAITLLKAVFQALSETFDEYK